MADKNIHLLKKAIFDKLNDDVTLRNLLGGTSRIVHREINKRTKYPCIVYSIINDRDFPYNEDRGESTVTQAFFRIFIYDKKSNTERVDDIEAQIKSLLHGQRTLDTDDIICYSCYRENLMEPMRDPNVLAWALPSRYKVAWAVK